MTQKKPSSRRKRWLIGGGIGFALLLGGYTAAYVIAGDNVPANASVGGVAIGGMSPEAAQQKLEESLAAKFAAPFTVADEAGHQITITPSESGLSVDYARTVADAGGGASPNPLDLFKRLFGGGDTALVTSVDHAALAAALQGHATAFAVEGSDATLAFEGGQIVRTEGTESTVLDIEATTRAVVQALGDGQDKAVAVLKVQQPAVTSAMVDEAVESFATPAMSAPIAVTVGEVSFEVTPEHIGMATTFAVEGDKLVPHVDAEKLLNVTAEARASLGLTTGKNASYTMVGGAIQVVPAEDGQQVDPEGLANGVKEAATKSGAERAFSVEVITGPAEFSTEEAEKLKPQQVIGEFTTEYPHADYRNTNLGRAAELINGKVLLPGDIFSLNDTLGPRTAENGFTDGYVINGGVLVKESGGGISQASTTMYNAGFFAGYEDIEHRPHTLYFPRYPAGREATIYYGSFDMKFKNNTEYPAYIEGLNTPSSSGGKGSITFRIWSIPTWDKVESTEPVKSNFYSGTDRVLDTPDCEPQEPIQGFTATWQRLFYKNGELAKTEDYSWTYSAGDRITCAPKGDG